MKTIYKANGINFNTIEDVKAYASNNGFEIENKLKPFIYNNKLKVICINLKSIN